MNSYNYSYNVLINRLEAFAAGHLLIKRFTHGQIDLADMDQNEQYPFMHVVPNNIKPVEGGMQFDFQILFADIPRDKETKAEYQREVISDCVRLAQDLIAEVKNGLILFGFDVQLVTPPVIEPFVEEYKNTLTGVSFSLQLEVPWDWSACDIPAVWSVGGTSSGGTGNAYGITLKTNGVNNAVQNILDLVAGTNITITDNGDGSVTFDADGGGGPQVYVSTEFNVNHTTATGNQYVVGDRVWYNGNVYACIANNDALLPTNTLYWTLQGAGFRLRQSPVDWNASSGDYQILNKPTIPAAQVNSDWNSNSGVSEILNKPTIPAAQVNSDWNAVAGVAQILNKPTLATVATTGSYTDLINQPSIPAAQVNSDWNAVAGVAEILNKPTIPAAQVNSDWNAVGGVAEILNKPTIPSAQGLQDVITTDPQLTTDNTIDGSNQQIEFSNFGKIGLLSNNKLDLYAGNTGLTATTNSISVGAEDGSVQSNITFDVNGSVIQSIDGADFTAITTEPNALKIATPNVAGATATVGQVLTLSNAATGEVEFTTVGGGGGGTVTSVGLTMPSAFTVTGSPILTAGTLAVTGAGLATQYVRGDGQLANFPTTSGGGSSVSYYLNGSINQGVIGGSTYYQMSKTAVFGAGTNFTRTNAAGNGLIAQFITDVNDPNVLLIPGGNFNIELFFTASSGGGSPSFYVELYKVSGSTFTLLATDVASPEGITQGTVLDAYFTALAVPATVMTATDRLALRVFVNTSGRTLVLHTENGNLCQLITTLSTGINAINGLTAQVQNLATGTAGSDFAISSAGSTHTFNIPSASNTNRGLLTSSDWSTFDGKQDAIGLTQVGAALATLPDPSAVRYLRINADNTVSALTLAQLKTDLSVGTDITVVLGSYAVTVGTTFEDVTGLSFAVSANKTYKWRATISFGATSGTYLFSSNGPTSSINNSRFTMTTGATTNGVSNQVTYDAGTNVTGSSNGLTTADGIVRVTASGTFIIRFRSSIAGALTVRAGSVLEYSEVL